MKKFAGTMMAVLCMVSLTACGSKKPTLEEVEKSIAEGNVTVEDALEKEWVTQEWVENYYKERFVPASDKMVENTIGEFSTTMLSGEEFTKNDLSPVTFFAFMDASDKDAQSFYDELKKAYEGVKEKGGDIVVCNKNTDEVTLFEGAPFPVIEYNDSLKKATENHKSMIEEVPNSGIWYVDGSFYSAWSMEIDSKSMIEEVEEYKKFLDERNSTDDSEKEGAMEAATMG